MPLRLSRHYYDLARLIVAGVAEQTVADLELLQRVVDHNAVFFPSGWRGMPRPGVGVTASYRRPSAPRVSRPITTTCRRCSSVSAWPLKRCCAFWGSGKNGSIEEREGRPHRSPRQSAGHPDEPLCGVGFSICINEGKRITLTSAEQQSLRNVDRQRHVKRGARRQANAAGTR